MNSREKGSRGERELADELCRRGILARRTVQYCGRSGDAADVKLEGTDVHVEVKRCERISLRDWVIQARRDSRGRPWVVCTRQNGGEWLVVQTLDQWLQTSTHAQDARNERKRIIDTALQAQGAGTGVRGEGSEAEGAEVEQPAEQVAQVEPDVQPMRKTRRGNPPSGSEGAQARPHV
jgi:Holliday junction resolvase